MRCADERACRGGAGRAGALSTGCGVRDGFANKTAFVSSVLSHISRLATTRQVLPDRLEASLARPLAKSANYVIAVNALDHPSVPGCFPALYFVEPRARNLLFRHAFV